MTYEGRPLRAFFTCDPQSGRTSVPIKVRKEADYFEDIPEEKIPKDILDLASHIVRTKAGHFDTDKF